ncbi:MAG TPA: pitrilysin family protein [Gemmatimonadaceae bacterium]|jgi:zinc protease|nr:pitrilysin family protein [Gemmatimonadaceae bacterium]
MIISTVLTAAMLAAAPDSLNRAVPPHVPPQPSLRVPAIEMRRLGNGIRVAVLENHQLPIVDVRAIVEAPGSVLDPAGKDGLSSLTVRMLSEGTTTRTADALASAFADLGNGVSPTGFFTITQNVDRSLALMAEQLIHPAFPEAALNRVKANTVAALQRQQDDADYLAGRVFDNTVYGVGHPWARAETPQSVGSITRADLVLFHDTYITPQNITLVVAGDITPDVAVAALERAFGEWHAVGKSGDVLPPPPKAPSPTTIYLFDRPSSPQSVLLVGQLGPRRDPTTFFPLELGNIVLGGAFNSRLNLDLRETHGYTYGASSDFQFRRVPQVGTFEADADVATPKTDSALVLLVANIKAIRGKRPVTDSELTFAKATEVRSLPRAFATVEDIAGAAAHLLSERLPFDYYRTLTGNYQRVTLAETRAALAAHLDPTHLAIVVVGDRKVIEPGLRAAGIGPVVVVGLNGKPDRGGN